jgi:hypothetical protein
MAVKMKNDRIGLVAYVALALAIVSLLVVAMMNMGLQDGSVGESKLADHAVTNRKMASDSISSDNIIDHTIESSDLSETLNDDISSIGVINVNSITSAMLLDGTIRSEDIANNTIQSSDIATGGIATRNLANNSVTAEKLATGTIGWDAIGNKPMEFVASGIIQIDGDIYEEYNIDEVDWDNTNECYEITIEDVTYKSSTHIALVSPIGDDFCTAVTSSNSGKLRVTLFDIDENEIEHEFSFVVLSF